MKLIGGALYVRIKRDDERCFRGNALSEGHPLIGTNCYACGKGFAVGNVIALVALGPGDDGDEQRLWHAGRYACAIAIPLHDACAGTPVEEIER